ncbi:MAG: chorismate-binding protein [Verrucomicrobiota bacterium]|nr:chorismate-binding protein [Verrucomicrobiota bacterium]
MSIYWRGKDRTPPPPHAQFFLFPFAGTPVALMHRRMALPSPTQPIRVIKRSDTPSKEEWQRLVEQAMQDIERGALEKVVLARETTLVLESAPEPAAVAAALKSTGAAVFCIEREGEAFVGATPERLFHRKGRQLHTEAMAGTRPLGDSFSEKEEREFQFVPTYIEAQLQPLCHTFAFAPVNLHQTSHVQHLVSRGAGTLKETVSDSDLLTALHPTPALCGTPKEAAFRWLEKHEPFARCWYGGVIGWTSGEESDWMVAIRSCKIEGNIARLYAGTGLVAGSNANAEWDELEAKIALYSHVFL